MEKITSGDLGRMVEGVKMSQYRSISPDIDGKLSGDTKQILIEVDFTGSTLEDVFTKAFGQAVISYANGPGRKAYAKLTKGQKVTVSFKAPGKRVETPEEVMAKGKTAAVQLPPEDFEKYIEELKAAHAEKMAKGE